MPISRDEFEQGSEISENKPGMAYMQPETAYTTKEIAALLHISHPSARQRLLRHLEKDEVIRKRIRGRVYWAINPEIEV